MLTRMIVVAVIEASLALLFFMHLAENRGLLWFVVIFNVSFFLPCNTAGPTAFEFQTEYPGQNRVESTLALELRKSCVPCYGRLVFLALARAGAAALFLPFRRAARFATRKRRPREPA